MGASGGPQCRRALVRAIGRADREPGAQLEPVREIAGIADCDKDARQLAGEDPLHEVLLINDLERQREHGAGVP
eukprot:14852397-Alexandrium_andersonii.AAC.1